jgi:parvulin-like peptidyl-prolyl isomerase
VLPLLLAACSDPPDETPLGVECAAILARPEPKADKIKVQHVLLAFVGAKKGSESKRTKAEAEKLAADVLARARAGEDFNKLVQAYSYEPNDVFTITPKHTTDDFVEYFLFVARRLAPGEVGVTSYHRTKSPFGWHVIKRVE